MKRDARLVIAIYTTLGAIIVVVAILLMFSLVPPPVEPTKEQADVSGPKEPFLEQEVNPLVVVIGCFLTILTTAIASVSVYVIKFLHSSTVLNEIMTADTLGLLENPAAKTTKLPYSSLEDFP